MTPKLARNLQLLLQHHRVSWRARTRMQGGVTPSYKALEGSGKETHQDQGAAVGQDISQLCVVLRLGSKHPPPTPLVGAVSGPLVCTQSSVGSCSHHGPCDLNSTRRISPVQSVSLVVTKGHLTMARLHPGTGAGRQFPLAGNPECRQLHLKALGVIHGPCDPRGG